MNQGNGFVVTYVPKSDDEMLRQMFTTPKFAGEYAARFLFGRDESSLAEEVSYVHADIKDDTRRLESVKQRVELISLAPSVMPGDKGRVPDKSNAKTVFIVHGHDDAVRETVARFVTKLDLVPIVLHEQANEGRTIVDKLETHRNVGFAIILLTPDDIGGPNAGNLRPRARQNVVLELGYFLGRLPRNRVCAIHKGPDLELPSDYMGVIYIPFDAAGGWRLVLARELRAAGLPVDMNKAI